MDPVRFDTLVKSLSTPGTRRGLVRLLAGLPLGVMLASVPGTAPSATAEDDDHGSSGRRHRRKTRNRRESGDGKENRKGKRKGRGKRKRTGQGKDTNTGTTDCTKRTCTAGVCGSQADGCGGTLQCRCGSNQLCDEGACRDCTVICPGGTCPGADTLQPKLAAGGTVYACPGRYLGNFTTLQNVTLIGAGEGDDPQVDTILDAGGVPGAGRVLDIPNNVTVELRQLRITGGQTTNDDAAGILSVGTKLTMRACTVTGNHAMGNDMSHTQGGGIFNGGLSQLVMSDCTISDNTASQAGSGPAYGGGIYNVNALELTRCRIAGNTAKTAGGGFYNNAGFPTLTDCEITDNELTAQAGGSGSGIAVNGHNVTLVNSFVWANRPEPQCSGAVNGGGCNVSPP
jgi:hypothetical protein